MKLTPEIKKELLRILSFNISDTDKFDLICARVKEVSKKKKKTNLSP